MLLRQTTMALFAEVIAVPDEREMLQRRVYPGIASFEYGRSRLPCIVLDGKKFDEVMGTVAGKPFSVNTNLGILHDGLGHVFVEVSLSFSIGGISEKFLINANDSLDFFESLAEHSMLVLSPGKADQRVLMVQLPKPEKARTALEIIRKSMKSR